VQLAEKWAAEHSAMKERFRKESQDHVTGAVISIGIFFVGVLLWWIIGSSLESSAYNRLTGSHTTTWDAMFLELRVQEGTK
jgi:hypothetical protein